ncbi:endonuclease/exonuclease/phosphatase family protein [bacterium]|nr:endonuclease/exonuclease/phosphatase family protein [bacterium]
MNKKFIESFNNFTYKRIVLLFVVFAIINIIANLPSFNFCVDIISHYKWQYFCLSFCFIFGFIYFSFFNKKSIIFLIISFIICLINYSDINKFYAKTVSNNDTGIKIGLFNVLTENVNYDLLLKEIEQNNPDIVILQEVDWEWLEHIEKIKSEYPYFVEFPRTDNFGIALYSKLKFENSEILSWTQHQLPVIKIRSIYNNSPFELYAIHTLPPVGKKYITIRNEMLNKIQEIVTTTKTNLILSGDWNTTIYSNAYKQYIAKSGMIDVQSSKGLHTGSWATYYIPFMRIPLEHIVVNKEIKINSCYLGNNFKSDHLPLYAILEF